MKNITDKQWSKIMSLIHSAVNWGYLDYTNEDIQRIERRIKTMNSFEASNLIEDLEDEKWVVAQTTLDEV